MPRASAALVLLALVCGSERARAQDSALPERLVLRFASEQARSSDELRALESLLGARLVRPLQRGAGYLYALPSGVDAEEAALRFARLPAVRAAVVDRACALPGAPQGIAVECPPDDPLFPQQWPLENTGQFGGTPDADIDAPQGWCIRDDASGILVAVTDTGIDVTHPDLLDELWTNELEAAGLPGVDDDANGFVDDVHGFDFVNSSFVGGQWIETEDPPNGPFDDHYHGTASAGTIGAEGDNGIGCTGVARHARIMAVKVMNALGQGYTSDIYDGVVYAVDNGARVINCSWVTGNDSPYLRLAIEYALANGVLCITAAGNSWTDIDEDPSQQGYPGAYDYTNQVTVGSIDVDGHLVGKGPQSFGYGSNYGLHSVQLCAPGVLGVTTEPVWRGAGGYRFTWGGTSMAMPHVVGLAALAWAQDPLQGFDEVRRRVVDAVDCQPQLDGLCETGGRASMHQLLLADLGPPAAVTTLLATQVWFDRVRVRWHETAEDGSSGWPAARYDLRYSLAPLDPAGFDAATVVLGEPQPLSASAYASGIVSGLEPSTSYHFLLQARDHHGNAVFSNATSITTPARPQVTSLHVTDEGPGTVDLAFSLPSVAASSFTPLFTGIDLRYASEPIDEASFAAATPVEGEPPIPAGGGPIALHVDGLGLGSTHWFALRLTDVYGQTSLVSNSVPGHSEDLSVVVFADDMESGVGGWVSDGTWALSSEQAYSGSHAWTDSPGGDYPPNREAILESPPLDLGPLNSALLAFQEVLLPHYGEQIYVEARVGGGSWTELAQIPIAEFHADWRPRLIDLGALAGQSDVRLRFRFVSNGTLEDDGWTIDDVVVGGE